MLFCLWSDVWGCLISCLTMFFLRREDVVKCTPYSCLFVSPNDSKPFIAAGLKILKRPLGDGTNSSCQLSGHTQNKIQTPWSKIWLGLLNCHCMNIAFHSCCFSSVTTNSGPRLRPFHPVCILLLTSLVHRPLLWMVEPNLYTFTSSTPCILAVASASHISHSCIVSTFYWLFIFLLSRAYLHFSKLSLNCSLLSLHITVPCTNIKVHRNTCLKSCVNLS